MLSLRSLSVLLFISGAQASVIFGPGGGITSGSCTASSTTFGSTAFVNAAGFVNCGGANSTFTLAASGSASGSASGPLFVGWDIAYTGNVTFSQFTFAVGSTPIPIALSPGGGSGLIDVSGVVGSQPINNWSITLLFSASGPTTAALNNLFISNVPFGNGSSQSQPQIPSGGSGGGWVFNNVASGRWFDPPFTNGYEYAGVGGTTFTSITLPTGFSSLFAISTGGTALGTFAGGSAIDFVALTGGAIGSFRVAGINPLVDVDDPTAFPLQIFFGSATGSFTQTAIPEPATLTLLVTGFALLLSAQRMSGRRLS